MTLDVSLIETVGDFHRQIFCRTLFFSVPALSVSFPYSLRVKDRFRDCRFYVRKIPLRLLGWHYLVTVPYDLLVPSSIKGSSLPLSVGRDLIFSSPVFTFKMYDRRKVFHLETPCPPEGHLVCQYSNIINIKSLKNQNTSTIPFSTR